MSYILYGLYRSLIKPITVWFSLKPLFLFPSKISFSLLRRLSPYTLEKASFIKIGRYVLPVTLEVSVCSKINSIPLNSLLFMRLLSMVLRSNSNFSYLSKAYCLYCLTPFCFLLSQILRRMAIAGFSSSFLDVFPVKIKTSSMDSAACVSVMTIS